MATFAPIVLADAQATPVNHTFNNVARDGLLLTWEDSSAGVYAGYNRITLQARPLKSDSGVYRVTIKVSVPKLAVTAPSSGTGVQPNPTKAYDVQSIIQFFLPAASVQLDRANARKFVANLLSNQQIIDAIELLAPPV